MSVPVNKRETSKFEFYSFGLNLSQRIIKFLMKDFGIKSVNRDLKAFTYNAQMSSEDRQMFLELAEKYNIDVEASYPIWILDTMRHYIMESLTGFLNCLVQAYSIFPINKFQVELQDEYIQKTLGHLNMLIIKMKFVIELFNGCKKSVDIEKYMIHVDDINKEIELVKKWRKSLKDRNKSIIAQELLNNTTYLNSSTNFVSHIVDQKLESLNIKVDKDFKINRDKLIQDCIYDMKDIQKNKEEKRQAKILKKKNIIPDKKISGLYYDYNNMIDIGNGIKIPNCTYDKWKTKILI